MRAALVAVFVVAGCTVGEGEGEVKGSLYVKNCYGTKSTDDYGTPTNPMSFDLRADFFSGEPIEDIKPNPTDNRLLIRLQTSGRRPEDNDMLVFDVQSWRVAQCVRGAPAVLATPELQRFCAHTPGQPPKVRVGPGFPITANLVLRNRCPFNPFVGTARDTSASNPAATPDDWTSWIRLKAFGSAAVDGNGARPDVDPSFKVEFGEKLEATAFQLDIMDDIVVRANAAKGPPPAPHIFGSLSGRFRFELQRGQGAQTFP